MSMEVKPIIAMTTYNNTDLYICEMLKSFKLVDIREHYKEEIDEAVKNNLGYKEFLLNLIKLEEEGKRARLVQKNINLAGFERYATFEAYDYAFHEHRYTQKLKELEQLNFIPAAENVILIGPPGVGKSHISTALGIKACEKGYSVCFINAAVLMNKLVKTLDLGTIEKEINRLNKIDLLIIDELGYINMNKEKESLFFQLIRKRYEKKALILTTNLPFKRWNEIFTSQVAATAILDRLVHHSHIISITGDSYRVKGESYEAKQLL